MIGKVVSSILSRLLTTTTKNHTHEAVQSIQSTYMHTYIHTYITPPRRSVRWQYLEIECRFSIPICLEAPRWTTGKYLARILDGGRWKKTKQERPKAGWLIGDWERRRSSRHPMAGQAQTTNPMSFFRPPSLPVCLSDCITKTPHNAPLPRDLGSSTSQPLLLRTSGEWVEMVVYPTR
jgi:hypothetical protein